jgi:hypothetical protein
MHVSSYTLVARHLKIVGTTETTSMMEPTGEADVEKMVVTKHALGGKHNKHQEPFSLIGLDEFLVHLKPIHYKV